MTPETDNILLNNIEDFTKQTSRTYCLDIEKNIITNYCDGIDAMKQTIYCILNTERFDYLIYSWNYGVEIKNLIGENATFVISELERVIKEALLQDDRITDINEFQFEISKNQVKVNFIAITSVGDVEFEKVVSI